MGLNSGRLHDATGSVEASTNTNITGVVAGDGTNIRAATAADGDALPVTGGTLGAQLSAKANKVQEDWITPTLTNGATGTMQYRKTDFGVVEFKGIITVAGLSQAVCLFPAGYQGGYDCRFVVKTETHTIGYFRFVGNLCYLSAGGLTGIDLTNIRYVAGA